jgi:hypothetical protein
MFGRNKKDNSGSPRPGAPGGQPHHPVHHEPLLQGSVVARSNEWPYAFPKPQNVNEVYALDNEQRIQFVQHMTQYALNASFDDTLFTLEKFSWSSGAVEVELQEFVPQNGHFVQAQLGAGITNVGAAGGALAASTMSNWFPGRGAKRLVFTLRQTDCKVLLCPGFMHYQLGPVTYQAQAAGLGQHHSPFHRRAGTGFFQSADRVHLHAVGDGRHHHGARPLGGRRGTPRTRKRQVRTILVFFVFVL